MSANLESQGLDHGFEVGAILSASAALEVEETLRDWADTFPWVYRADATRGEHLGDFCPVEAELRDGVMKVTALHTQSAPAVLALDALAPDDATAGVLEPSPPRGELPQRVAFAWEIVPPRLPDGATERLQQVQGTSGEPKDTSARIPHDPRVFDHGGKVYVVLDSAADAERVRQAAAKFGATVVLTQNDLPSQSMNER